MFSKPNFFLRYLIVPQAKTLTRIIKTMFKPIPRRLFPRAMSVSLLAAVCAGGFVFSRHAEMQERRDNISQTEQPSRTL